MEQQKKDEKRGVIYKSGVALDSNMVPYYIREGGEQEEGAIEGNLSFFRWFLKGHVTNGAKKCRYNGTKTLGQLNSAVNDYLAKLYPENYCECC